MAINVTTSKQQITASVAEDKISATVSGGFGATGPSGVINVTAPITNAGTTTAANVGLAVGTGLSVSGGSLVVTPDTYATLVGGKVPADQLPSYVDDVLEYANLASLPGTGESGKIYVALNTGKIYRWSGSAYFEISTQPGNTDAVPEGSTNLYFTNARARNSFGTGASGQVVRWDGSEWTAGTVPIASGSVVGGVRIGSGISIDGNGVISASAGYTLPQATNSTLGGITVSTGLSVASGALSVSYGTTSGTACQGDDARLSDARTPTAHNQAWSTITSTPTTLSGYGITDGVTTSDSRLSDARTPTAGSVTDSSITSGGLSASSINWVAIQPWAANTAYQKGDLVSYLGVAYRRSAAGTSGTTFNTANWQKVTPSLFTVRSAVVSSTAYTGRAVSGSATSDSVWTIRRAIYTSAGAVSATATATNVKWDDRLTASYS